jgi:hypothetical protein
MRHIVYIIAAGLPRALQQELKVPLLNDFLAVMADHVDNPVIRVYGGGSPYQSSIINLQSKIVNYYN